MFGVMLIVSNDRERQILKLAFEQRKINILVSQPTYANFIKILQYMPDLVVMEMPNICNDEARFATLIRKYKKTKAIPILGYGDPRPEGVRRGFAQKGVRSYFVRPLKFSAMMAEIETIAKHKNKNLESRIGDSDRAADTEQILHPDTLPQKKIELMMKHISNLLAFPFTVAKVLQLTQDEKSGAGDLSRAIEADPVISASILKVSNTVFFASLNRKINSIKDAIVRIGFRETKRIVTSMAVMQLFDDEQKNLGFDRREFWHHSLACGVICEKIARRMGDVSPEEAFLAGLLHDFGIILLDEFFPDIFAKVLEKTSDRGSLFIDEETALLGIHHNDLVVELFGKWKFPESIVEGVPGQYKTEQFKGNTDTAGKRLAICVALSDALAKSLQLGRECDHFVRPIENWTFQTVKMPTGFSSSFLDSIHNEVAMFRKFLRIEDTGRERGRTAADIKQKICFANHAKDLFVPPLLYLQKEGFTIDQLNPPERSACEDGAYELSLVWAGRETPPEIVREFGQVIRPSSGAAAGQPEFAPVVAIVPAETGFEQDAYGQVTLLNHGFDLRTLESRIVQTLTPQRTAPTESKN